MREFEFVVAFRPGADELMDVFREYSGLTARSSVCVCNDEAMWRIDHLNGSPEALETLDGIFLDEDRCNECLDAPNCDTYREYQVLDRSDDARTVYTYRREVHRCHSIPYVVYEHVGEGVVFEARRSGGEYRWKVLLPDERPLGELYDAIEDELREGLELEMSHLRTAGNWEAESRAAAELSQDHREVLQAAFERGYYERPRGTTVDELGDVLDLPRSTVQYRLRSAEDTILRQFVRSAL